MTDQDKVIAVEFFEYVQKNLSEFKDIKDAWKAFIKEKGL